MRRDLDRLGTLLREREIDGYLVDASGDDPSQRYLSGFGGHDPFVSLTIDGAVHLLVRGLERAPATETSHADTVSTPAAFAHAERDDDHDPTAGDPDMLVAFLREHGAETVAVPARFPVGKADALRDRNIEIRVDEQGLLAGLRAIKHDEEIEHIRTTQRATEVAMDRAEGILSAAKVSGDTLVHEEEVLTSERVREEISVALLRQGFRAEDTIVACGLDAAKPHERGSGPLRPNVPIVIDIFPRDEETRYHADMTRTFCVGTPHETIQEWHELTVTAQEAAFETLGPGVRTAAVHDAVCDVYEEAGIATNRSEPGTDTGFVHGTGHGVGLAVHEGPRITHAADDGLRPGHVVTIEPGVYDPTVGGIRVEDLIAITSDGFENLTDYHRRLVV